MPSLFPEPSQPRVVSPRVPPSAWVLAHCDGGARGNPGPAGYGAVLTDSGGEVLAELSEFLGIRTNNFAEYAGLLACLQWALEHGYKNLRVVSDSLLMVSQIQGKYKVKSPDLLPLWQEARRRIAQLDAFEIAHALRHKNKDADRLANEAMDKGMGRGAKGAPQATPYPTRQAGSPASAEGAESVSSAKSPVARGASSPERSAPMLRGFTRNGTIHLLGAATLPDGIFVKILPE